MASRAQQKQQARLARIEREQKLAFHHRVRMMLLIVTGAIIVVGATIAISIAAGSGSTRALAPNSDAAAAAARRIEAQLKAIPQSVGNVLGDPGAKVTITEFSDLQCSACDAFDLPSGTSSPSGVAGNGILDALIRDVVVTGKAKLVFRSLETATAGGATPQMWVTQQAAVNAAGLQGKAWNYIKLFYSEQGAEGTAYVTMDFLKGLARQIPGLRYDRWLNSLQTDPAIRAQVESDNRMGTQLDNGTPATPTIWVNGPRNEALFQSFPGSAAQATAAIEHAVKAAA